MLRKHAPALALLLLGPVLFVCMGLGHGFDRMPGDPGDARLVQYLLEHSYQWLTGGFFGLLGPVSLLDPPGFFPAEHVYGYSHLLLGSAPVYWLWRLLGMGWDSALQAWCLTVLVLDFAVAWLWLRRGLGLRSEAAAVGAFVFAASTLRLAQVAHHQMLPSFWAMACLLGLTVWLREPSHPRRGGWLALAAVGAVLELYSSFYQGFFLGFSLLLALLAGLALPRLRATLAEALRTGWKPLLLTAAIATAALAPLVAIYVETAGAVGMRSYAELEPYVPGPPAWVNLGSDSLLWGWLYDPQGVALVAATEPIASVGLLTSLAALGGLALRWRGVGGALLFLWVAVVVLATGWAPGLHAWRTVFELFPGASAIREVSRLAFITIVPAAAGVAFLVQHCLRRQLGVAAAALALLLISEQPRSLPSFDKDWSREQVATLADAVDPERCTSFYYSPLVGPDLSRAGPWYRLHWVRFQTDAMLAQLDSGVPTLNGYTGNYPPGWRLDDPVVDAPEDLERLTLRLRQWMDASELPAEGFCWLQVPVED